MYYPEYNLNNIEMEIPNPYGLPPDPVFEDNNENQNDNIYFNKVIKQMYHTHKNEFLFPNLINTSKSMEISNLHPLQVPVKSHSKKTVNRHKSDPTNHHEKKKNHSSKRSKTNSSNNNSNKSGTDAN